MILNGFEGIIHRVNNWYARVLGRVLNPMKISYPAARIRAIEAKEAIDGIPRRKHYNVFLASFLVFVGIVIIFISSFGLISNGYIGTAFIQPGDRGEFIMKLELPKDATLRETNLATQKAEMFFEKKKKIRTTVIMSFLKKEIFVSLKIQ